MILSRFAGEARACVKASVEEARDLGHDSIGDEDLLLGILRCDEGLAAEALSSLGVTLEAAREESGRMAADALSSIGVSMEDIRRQAGDAFDLRIPEGCRIPFSPRAKGALAEALRLRDNRIGTEHVLLGILAARDGTAVRMLARLSVEPGALEDRLRELRGKPDLS